MDRRIQTVLEGAVRLLREELSAGLTGIYAHGSLAMGCFNSMLSDIDLLVVVREPRARHTYRRIADKLIRLEEEQPIGAGIELSVVLETYAKAFVHPTPFNSTTPRITGAGTRKRRITYAAERRIRIWPLISP